MSNIDQRNMTSDVLRADQAGQSICSAIQSLEFAHRCLGRISTGAPGGSQLLQKMIADELPRLGVRLQENIKAAKGGAL